MNNKKLKFIDDDVLSCDANFLLQVDQTPWLKCLSEHDCNLL